MKAVRAGSSDSAAFVPLRNATYQAGRSVSALTQEFERASLPGFTREEAASYRGASALARSTDLGSRSFWAPGTKSNRGARKGVEAKFWSSGTSGGTRAAGSRCSPRASCCCLYWAQTRSPRSSSSRYRIATSTPIAAITMIAIRPRQALGRSDPAPPGGASSSGNRSSGNRSRLRNGIATHSSTARARKASSRTKT